MPEETQLTPEEETQAEMAVNAALFDVDNGSTTVIGEGMTPELLAQFQKSLISFHASDEADEDLPATIHEIVGKPELKDSKSFKSKEEAKRELDKILKLLARHKIDIYIDSVDDYDTDDYDFGSEEEKQGAEDFMAEVSENESAEAYGCIVKYIMPFRLHPDDAEEGIEANLEQFFPDETLEFMAESCSFFLLSLLNVTVDLRTDLLDEKVSIDGKMVSREIAALHLNDWKKQFKSIKVHGYQSGRRTEDDESNFVDYDFMISYETVRHDGQIAVHQGVGRAIMQEDMYSLDWLVSGLTMPGFKL